MKKKKIGFWRWCFQGIGKIINFGWNEGPMIRWVFCYLIFLIAFIVLIVLLHPSDEWLKANQWFVGIVFIPVPFLFIRGLYRLYEWDVKP